MAQRAFDRGMAFPPQATTTTSSAAADGAAAAVVTGAGAAPSSGDPNVTMNSTTPTTAVAAWINEETAEEDKVLAVLSEGAEIYLRSVLEKALHCARQRQNVDGLRLWHQQYIHNNKRSSAASLTPEKNKFVTTTSPPATTTTSHSGAAKNRDNNAEEDDDTEEEDRPALSLRLGCNVVRQVARAAGNAATLCHRAEQALQRHQQQRQYPALEGPAAAVTPEILARATSLSEVALRPRLRRAVEMADAEAKRQLDVYGGRDAEELPPLGRLPKRARLEVIDFRNGMNFARPGRRRHRASTNSSSFQY